MLLALAKGPGTSNAMSRQQSQGAEEQKEFFYHRHRTDRGGRDVSPD